MKTLLMLLLGVAATPTQRIDLVNLLWNPNATGGNAGFTAASVNVVFYNGDPNACYSATVPYQGALTVLAGPGQVCVNEVTTMSCTPVDGTVAGVWSPAPTTNFNTTFFENQVMIRDGTDPVFDTTNGFIQTAGNIFVQVTAF